MRTDFAVTHICSAIPSESSISSANPSRHSLKPELRLLTTLVLVWGSLVFGPNLLAQRGGAPGGGGNAGGAGAGGAGAGNVSTGPTAPSVGRFPTPSQPFPGTGGEMQRPIFLSGRVLFDDGTKPTRDIVIQRVCVGNPHAEAYTDSKGHFSFQVGQNQMMMTDASMDGSFGQPDFGGGGRL